jgi:hypothetical protein
MGGIMTNPTEEVKLPELEVVEPTDEQLSKAAYKGYDDYWTENCAGEEDEAWLASAKAVLALTKGGA